VEDAAIEDEWAFVGGERAVGLADLAHDVIARLEKGSRGIGEAVDDAGHRLRCSSASGLVARGCRRASSILTTWIASWCGPTGHLPVRSPSPGRRTLRCC